MGDAGFFDIGGKTYVDLALIYSQANRVGLRQGLNYHIDSVIVQTKGNSNDTFNIQFATIPHNYISLQAWRYGFDKWMKQQSLSDTPSGQWADFKIWMNTDHQQDIFANSTGYSASTLGTVAQPVNSEGTLSNRAGEWIKSTYLDMETGNEPAIQMLGTSNTSMISLIDELSHVKRTWSDETPQIPTEANTTFLENFLDSGASDVVEDIGDNLDAHNDIPPYGRETYTGEFSNAPEIVSACSTYAGGVTIAGGFEAICGLVEVQTDVADGFGATAVYLTFNFTEGTYHGIHAERLI
tara:strand:- start:527 stop:1414 length:888 start_codon:yes stop_codon:yes gene_type:complete